MCPYVTTQPQRGSAYAGVLFGRCHQSVTRGPWRGSQRVSSQKMPNKFEFVLIERREKARVGVWDVRTVL